tara:strand:+ start:1757 stop:2047 length:291 start_codon:yes stop_codon:yes gene_type:complete
MKRSPDDIPRYAPFVRGYVFPFESPGFLGSKKTWHAVCYFGDPGDGTRFVALLVTDSSGSVRREEFAGAVIEAYKKLSGKELSILKQSMLIMSIPN